MFLLQLDPHHRQGQPERDSHQEHAEHRDPELSKHLRVNEVVACCLLFVLLEKGVDRHHLYCTAVVWLDEQQHGRCYRRHYINELLLIKSSFGTT